QVAEEHRRRLHEVLAEGDSRELERYPTRLQDAALHRLAETPEVEVAIHELRPRVADPDHGPTLESLLREALRPQCRPMNETADVLRREPTLAPKPVAVAAVGAHPRESIFCRSEPKSCRSPVTRLDLA